MARRAIVLAAVLGAGLAGTVSTGHADDPTIAAGVRVGGIDLSGLTVADAATRLEQQLTPIIDSPLTVTVAKRTFTLNPADVEQSFDAHQTAQRAFNASLQAVPATGVDVAPVISLSPSKVRAFVDHVASATGRPPRDAHIRITVKRMIKRPGRKGFAIHAKALVKEVDGALRDPRLPRALMAERLHQSPDVTTADLRHRYATVVTVDRRHFKLRLFKHLRRVKIYGIAVGRAGLETPRGVFHVQEKQRNPAWHVPNRPWAGSLAGQTIPGGAANNPLKARWMGLGDGIGIHGTAEGFSIGSRASHGCIRMHVSDVIKLYRRVPVGTRVLIH